MAGVSVYALSFYVLLLSLAEVVWNIGDVI
jgi:hypothetical protein